MSILDDIMKRKVPDSPGLDQKVLGESGHAEDVYLDRQPGIVNRHLGRFSPDARVHQEGANDLTSGQVTIGVTATLIAKHRSGRAAIIVVNHGTTDVFLSDGSVSLTSGLLLVGSKGASLTLGTVKEIYGIAGASQVISFMEIFT